MWLYDALFCEWIVMRIFGLAMISWRTKSEMRCFTPSKDRKANRYLQNGVIYGA